MKHFKCFLIFLGVVFLKLMCYVQLISASLLVQKQMPNPEIGWFLFSVFVAIMFDFCSSLLDTQWRSYVKKHEIL
jgi:hypothetical protein